MWAEWIGLPADDDPALLAWIAAGPPADPEAPDAYDDMPEGEGWVCGVCLHIHGTEPAAEACHRCPACGGATQEETDACPKCEPLFLYRPDPDPF